METLSIGKIRSLQQCTAPEGAFSILALDHRNNLRQALNPAAPETVGPAQMIAFKQQVVRALAPAATAVLLDPEVGGAQGIAAGALPGTTGLIMAMEATGYTGDPTARQSRILPEWNVAKARRMGASAVKLLVYYHPHTPSADTIEKLVRHVAEECLAQDIAFFLEPLSYSPNPSHKKLSPQERRRVVIETARRLVVPGVDVLKAEFPLDITAEPDEAAWAQACAELSAASRAPWVLLSAAVDFATFKRQVRIACQQGASGIAVGRAVWQEAPAMTSAERLPFLENVARPRMEELTALCIAAARPWTDFYTPTLVTPNWYAAYGRARI
jgi:tagatose-1,6-bisphosphate aldolase